MQMYHIWLHYKNVNEAIEIIDFMIQLKLTE